VGVGSSTRVLPPLFQEGEAFLYIEPFPLEAARLSFSIESLAIERAEGGPAIPLEVLLPDLRAPEMTRQRLLAYARLAPGTYNALLVKVKRATLAGEEGVSDLLVAPEPTRIPIALDVGRGRSTLLSLSLVLPRSLGPAFAFSPAFAATIRGIGIAQLAGFVSNTGTADLTVFDRHTHRAVAAVPVGRAPQGLALDALRNRVYVALADEAEIQALDLITGTELDRIRLRPGDRPRELALTPDARTLLATNSGTNSVSFVDTSSAAEIDRVHVGDEPSAILLDRSGRRAYVLNHRAGSMSVLDVANRSVVATIGTDPLPERAQLDRAGTRLYVVGRGSPYMSIFSLPDLSLSRRVFVGLGAMALKVDTRTDLVFVGRPDDSVLEVYDPFSFLPLDRVQLPYGAAYLVIDDLENTMLALAPGRRAVVFVELTTRRVVGALDVGFAPAYVTIVGERN
jgi:YVTN family beta-propeller protein